MASNKFTKAQEDAMRYVGQHNLERFITTMLNRTVQVRPQNPKVFMIQYIAETVPASQLAEAGITIGSARPPEKVSTSQQTTVPRKQGKAIATGPSLEPAAPPPVAAAPEPAKPAPAPAAETATVASDPVPPAKADWATVADWESFVRLAGTGEAFPAPGTTSWLADHVTSGGKDAVMERLEWLATNRRECLSEVDSSGINIATAICQKVGDGPWTEWLVQQGFCTMDPGQAAPADADANASPPPAADL